MNDIIITNIWYKETAMNFVADINNPQKEEIQNLLDYIKELISEK